MKSKQGNFLVTLTLTLVMTQTVLSVYPVMSARQPDPEHPTPATATIDRIFTTFPGGKERPMGIILSMMEDRRGDVWFGALNGQLHRFRKDGRQETIPVPAAAGTGLGALAQDRDGNIWIGTFGKGVFRLKNGGSGFSDKSDTGKRKRETGITGITNLITYLTTRHGLADNTVHSIFFDSKGNAWFGTQDGVSRYDGSVMATLKQNRGLVGSEVRNVYEDRRKNIWIATNRGITVLEDGRFESNRQTKYLEGESVTGIYIDEQIKGMEQYWITTYGAGLKRIKNGNVTSYTWENGIATNILYQVMEDERKKLWITSGSGVLRVSKKKLEDFAEGRIKWIVCTVFGIRHGMESIDFYNGFSRHSVLKTPSGRFMFATKKAVYVVKPGEIKIDKVPPRVVIGKMTLTDSGSAETVIRLPEMQDTSKWPEFKKADRWQFYFTARTDESPESITYKYMLEGQDADWRYLRPGAPRTAVYGHLPPGTYTFKVTAANSDGVWNKAGASYTFKRNRTFRETLLFKVLLTMLSMMTIAAGYFVLRKKRKRKMAPKGVGENGKSTKLHPAYVEEVLKKLSRQMEQEKSYREENLSLQELAEKLSIPPHHLSQVINEKLNKNFSDYVNTYRIEEAMKHLADPRQDNRKILSIAFEVGFNTKATFNYVFKKHTGMTPSQYRKKS